MPACGRCGSRRLCSVTAKCSDMCSVEVGDKETHGYVPGDLGIGGSDYVELTFCLDCGQIQGGWPKPPTKLEEK